MNKILVVSLCLVVFSIILFYAMGFNVENISTNEIRNKLSSSDANIGIIDVRTKSEYESGHIENSLWIPLSQLESNIEKIKSKNYDEIYTICLISDTNRLCYCIIYFRFHTPFEKTQRAFK